MGLGMGSVFIILSLLILIIVIVSKIVPQEASLIAVVKPHEVDPAHIAAISAALHLHRHPHDKKR